MKVHQNLLRNLITSTHTRQYIMWCYIRERYQDRFGGHIDPATFVAEYATATGRTIPTVKRWLKEGDGYFWDLTDNSISIYGKNKIFKKFLRGGEKPGVVLLVPYQTTEIAQIKNLRAFLYSHLIPRKIFASRDTLEKITGVCKRKQIEYEQIAHIQVNPHFEVTIIAEEEGPVAFQTANIYRDGQRNRYYKQNLSYASVGINRSQNNGIRTAAKHNTRFLYDTDNAEPSKSKPELLAIQKVIGSKKGHCTYISARKIFGENREVSTKIRQAAQSGDYSIEPPRSREFNF